MRDFFLPVGLLVLAGALVLVFWRPSARVNLPGESGPYASAATVQVPEAAAPKSVAKKRTIQQDSPRATDIGAAESIVPDVPQPVAVPSLSQAPPSQATLLQPTARRSAAPDDIGVGMPSVRVIELLGRPDLKATTILNGSLLETYIYSDPAQGEFLRVQLRGGRVVSQVQ